MKTNFNVNIESISNSIFDFLNIDIDNRSKYYFDNGCNSMVYLYNNVIIKEPIDEGDFNFYDEIYYNFKSLYNLFPNNIPKVYSYEDDKLFMEYIKGDTLFNILCKGEMTFEILDNLFCLLINLFENLIYISDLNSKNLIYSSEFSRFYIIDIEEVDFYSSQNYLPCLFDEFDSIFELGIEKFDVYFLDYVESRGFSIIY